MKRKTLLIGVIFFGFGLYFLLQQYNINLLKDFYSWPTLLLIIGIGFLVHGYLGKEYEAILPGVIFTGLAIHFHVMNKLNVWPDHAGIFLLVIALGLLLRYVKTGHGLVHGTLFLAAAILLLFFDRLLSWAMTYGHDLTVVTNIWPFFFLAAGAYFLFFKRR